MHGKENVDCWLIPKTHCSNFISDDFFQKLSNCLTCKFFKKRGESNPKGWNEFLADQLRKYNQKTIEQIYRKEESFVEILNRIPDGLFTIDKDWRITYFNPAAEKITGFTAGDAVGMYCKDVFKSSICEADCALRRAISEGGDVHNREYEITDIDGRKVPIMCSTSVFRDPSGRMTGGLEIFKDVSDVKKLQEEVAKREKKYRRIFEGSHDMIYTSTLEGDFLDINQAGVDMIGYLNKKDLLKAGSAKSLYKNPQDREKFINLINLDGFVKDFEVDFARHDGTPIHVLVSSSRYENSETGVIEYEGIIKDISRRKKAEKLIRSRNRELSILNSIAVALNFSMGLKHLLKVTLERVLRVLTIQQGGIFLFDRKEHSIVLQASVDLPVESLEQTCEIVFKDVLLQEYLLYKDIELSPEASFPSFKVRYRTGGCPLPVWLSCHLIISKGKTVGFFGFVMPQNKVFDHHEIHFLGSLGNFIGGAIENTRLMETIKQNRVELRQLTGKLFQSQEEERMRIARELHDEAGQSLTAVKLELDGLEQKVLHCNPDLKGEFKQIRKMLVRTSSEIRNLSYNLHPTLLSDLGLEPALNLYYKEIMRHSGLDVSFQMIGFDKRLDGNLETALYRFSQEATTNTLKHSGAETFMLKIIKSYPKVIFMAEDDGVGFDEENLVNDQRSLGLVGMRERALLLGGSFQIKGRPGQGARIRIEINLTDEKRDD